MKITAAERLTYFQLEADAAFDVAINREAKAIFELFFKRLRAARLNKTFFSREKTTDQEYGITYQNTYLEPLRYPEISGMHFITARVGSFANVERGKDLHVALAIHDDLSSKRLADFFGRKNSRGNVIVLYEYLEPDVYDENNEFPYSGFRQLIKETLTPGRNSPLKNNFVHEYTHFIDAERARERRPSGNQSKTISPDSDYAGYINSKLEVNARYAEWIVNIVESFSRLLAVKQGGVGERFPDFASFWKFYWTHPGYVPVELRLYASKETQQRLARRLYKFWEWSVAQQKSKTLINDKTAMNFVKKQIMREFRGDRSAPDRFHSPSAY